MKFWVNLKNDSKKLILLIHFRFFLKNRQKCQKKRTFREIPNNSSDRIKILKTVPRRKLFLVLSLMILQINIFDAN